MQSLRLQQQQQQKQYNLFYLIYFGLSEKLPQVTAANDECESQRGKDERQQTGREREGEMKKSVENNYMTSLNASEGERVNGNRLTGSL